MGIKILVADDDVNIRLSLQQVFSDQTVITAGNGETAVRMVIDERPAIVLLDIDMPGMSGLEVLAALKEIKHKPVIYMLTGNDKLEMAVKTLEAGAKSYITKPFEVADIRRIILEAAEEGISGQKASARPWTVKKEGE
ncbi:MAG: response regulator [Elusimicrobiales bacterium]|jgi:DNA-binding response OmpR family regulator